jgi:Sulfotransferase domain.
VLKKIYWIASYPKSGNTWMRSIVASLLFSKDGLFNFGLLKLIEQFDKKKWFEFIEKNNFDIKNISKYWIEAQERIIIEDNYNILFNFFKTHSLNAIMDNNQFTNTNVSGGLVYLIRDPRDVYLLQL